MSLLILYCYIADIVFGDPDWFPHPVRWMGRLISFLDGRLVSSSLLLSFGERVRGIFTERIKGVILALLVMAISSSAVYLFIAFSKKINPLLGHLVWIYFGYTTLSIRDLQVKTKDIQEKIEKGSIVEARKSLSNIVGRDTNDLDADKITIATIESIAESTNDGIIAPLFYLILGGPVLAVAYKAINTLDSMVGYKNDRYVNFGWFSARLDDIVNFIPARISGFLISVSSFVSGKGGRYPLETMLRDSRKHPSPNSGLPESAMAGALGVRLGGAVSYQGILSTRPYIGEDKRVVDVHIIDEALNISFVASLIMVSIGVGLRWVTG